MNFLSYEPSEKHFTVDINVLISKLMGCKLFLNFFIKAFMKYFVLGNPMVRRLVSRFAEITLSRRIYCRRNTSSKRRTSIISRNRKG